MLHRPSTPSNLKKLAVSGYDSEMFDKIKGSPEQLLVKYGTVTPQTQMDQTHKLLRKKSTNHTNFNRYQNLTDKGPRKSKSRNVKLLNKPFYNSKKSRNNLTLDGMNLSSIELMRHGHNNSYNLKHKSGFW